MTTDSVTQGVAHSANGRLPELDFENRPSGAKLGIVDLPNVEVSVAPFTLAHIRVPRASPPPRITMRCARSGSSSPDRGF